MPLVVDLRNSKGEKAWNNWARVVQDEPEDKRFNLGVFAELIWLFGVGLDNEAYFTPGACNRTVPVEQFIQNLRDNKYVKVDELWYAHFSATLVRADVQTVHVYRERK